MEARTSAGPSGRKVARRIIAAVIGTVAVGLLALAAASIVPRAAPGTQAAPAQAEAASSPQQAAQSPDWGGEVLRNARDRAFAWAPFPVANACGIGASSCFKCHNGTRAIAPKDDKAKAPWHPDHQVVTDDCVGCHGGNPRIVRKDLAHNKLVANPLTSVDACTHCHKAGDAPALLKKYQQVASAGGK